MAQTQLAKSGSIALLIKDGAICRLPPKEVPNADWLSGSLLRLLLGECHVRQIGPHTPRGSLQRHLLPDEWKVDIQRRCRDERGIPQGGGGAGSQAASQHWGPPWGEADLWLRL